MPPHLDLFAPVQAWIVGGMAVASALWWLLLREPTRTCRFCGHQLRPELECAKSGWQCRDTHACIGRERSKPEGWWRK